MTRHCNKIIVNDSVMHHLLVFLWNFKLMKNATTNLHSVMEMGCKYLYKE
jgi:hypothetical protein